MASLGLLVSSSIVHSQPPAPRSTSKGVRRLEKRNPRSSRRGKGGDSHLCDFAGEKRARLRQMHYGARRWRGLEAHPSMSEMEMRLWAGRTSGASETGDGGRGALPGLGRWGAFPPGKSRGSGHRSLSTVLPNEAITFPGPNFHAGFSPMEKAGNPAGFGASKPAHRECLKTLKRLLRIKFHLHCEEVFLPNKLQNSQKRKWNT